LSKQQTMNRSFCRLALLALVVISLPASAQHPATKKNIILIISDDHRFDAMGVAGNKKISTPHLDALAASGFYFPQATIHSPQCSPSRSAILSGQPAHRNGVFSNDIIKEAGDSSRFFQQSNLPQLLQSAGYLTFLSGKWHVPAEPWNIGFEEIRYWMPGGAGAYKDPQLAFGKTKEKKKTSGFTNEIFASEVISFLASPAAKEKPFFVWFSATAPHAPYKPNPRRIQNIYEGQTAKQLLPPAFPEQYTPGDLLHYYQAISFLDELVGRIMQTLDKTKLSRETIVVFVGDNGLMMGSRGMKGKVNPYEESVRVPLIIRLPHQNDSVQTISSPVSSLDISPTILALAGVKVPASWPGKDISGWLQKGKKNEQDYAITEWADNEHGYAAYRLIRTKEYKLIVWENRTKPMELYHLSSDRHETTNLAGIDDYKKIQQELLQQLRQWMTKTSDPALNWKTMQ
jgi:arylsulfatase A-like enzyme